MSTRSVALALFLSLAVLVPSAVTTPALAHDHTSVRVGIGIGPYYSDPYYPRYGYRNYYHPPAVIYEPPAVYVAPPRVVYAEPPVLLPAPTANNGMCREYQAKVMINGKPQNSYGTACRQPDGTWKIIN